MRQGKGDDAGKHSGENDSRKGRGDERRQKRDREEGRDQRVKWKLGGLHYAAGVSYLSQLD